MCRRKLMQLLVLLHLSVFILGGCSLSDDDSDSTADISGVVNKGIVIGGRVDAYAIVAGRVVDEVSLAHDITDTNGKYSLNVTKYNGPLALVMSPVGDGSSKVKCDVPTGCVNNDISYEFGSLMPFNYSMEALISKVSGSAIITASITPMTYMAAVYAKEFGLDEDGIAAANQSVAKLFEIDDILGVEPVDITDNQKLASNTTSVAEIKYGYFAAGIAAIANNDNNGDVDVTLEFLANSYVSNAGQLTNNESNPLSSNISLEEISSATKALIEAESDVSGGVFGLALTEISGTNEEASSAEPNSITEVVVDVNVSESDIVKAKAMVTELRTWGVKAEEEMSTGTLAFAGKLATLESLSEEDLQSVFVATALSAGAMAYAYINEQVGEPSGGQYLLADVLAKILEPDEIIELAELGDVAGVIVIDGQDVTLNGAELAGSTINMSATMPANSGTTFTLEIDPSTVSNDSVEINIAASSASVSFEGNVDDFLTIVADETGTMTLPTPTAVSLDLQVSLGQKATTTVTDPITFTGKLAGSLLIKELADRVDGLTENVNPESLVMEGTFSTFSGDSFSAKFEAEMTNADIFIAVDQLPEGTERQNLASYSFSADGNSLVMMFPDETMTVSYNPDNDIVTMIAIEDDDEWFFNFGVYDSLQDFLAENTSFNGSCSSCLTSYVKQEGEYAAKVPETWLAGGGTLDGELIEATSDDENADMWRDIDGSLTLTVDYVDYPEAKVVLNLDRTAFEAFTASMQISYDDVSIVAQGDIAVNEGEEELDISIIVTTSNGDKLEIYPTVGDAGWRGSIRVNGNAVGVIKPSPLSDDILIVTFVNGDIETVNL